MSEGKSSDVRAAAFSNGVTTPSGAVEPLEKGLEYCQVRFIGPKIAAEKLADYLVQNLGLIVTGVILQADGKTCRLYASQLSDSIRWPKSDNERGD